MNPKHRDRIAFLRIVSGKFERNTLITTCARKDVPGGESDGFHEPGPGDHRRSGRGHHRPSRYGHLQDRGYADRGRRVTKGIPSFAPQIFRSIMNADPLKEKQYHKGLDQLAEEGVVQIFSKIHQPNARVLGVVGQLQLEVLQNRSKRNTTRRASTSLSTFQSRTATSDDEKALKTSWKRTSGASSSISAETTCSCRIRSGRSTAYIRTIRNSGFTRRASWSKKGRRRAGTRPGALRRKADGA